MKDELERIEKLLDSALDLFRNYQTKMSDVLNDLKVEVMEFKKQNEYKENIEEAVRVFKKYNPNDNTILQDRIAKHVKKNIQ